MSLPDVHTGQQGKETATEAGERNRTQRWQAAVTPQPHGLEGDPAVSPHTVVAVCGRGLCQNIAKLDLVSQWTKFVSFILRYAYFISCITPLRVRSECCVHLQVFVDATGIPDLNMSEGRGGGELWRRRWRRVDLLQFIIIFFFFIIIINITLHQILVWHHIDCKAGHTLCVCVRFFKLVQKQTI